MGPLLLMSPGENHPAVECGRSALAASAGPYPHIGSRPFDGIAKPDLLVGDESGQAHPVRPEFALDRGLAAFACSCHAVHCLAFVVERNRQAAATSSNGGTTEARLGVDGWVTASLMCAAVADGNADHSSAVAPVTNGTATLVPPSVSDCPSAPRLVTRSPGALRPRLPIELPRFESFIGLPRRSQATTGMTHG